MERALPCPPSKMRRPGQIMRYMKPGLVLILLVMLAPRVFYAQTLPSEPLSIPVFHPMVLNPAYTGSKDFTHISLSTKALRSPSHQIACLHTRIGANHESFTPFGLGAYLFRNQYESYRRPGFALAGAYHFRLDKEFVHMLSVGASLKASAYLPKSAANEGERENKHFDPNMDFGLYYYGPNAFAGISATQVFGSKTTEDIDLNHPAYISRSYHLFGGYKIMLNRESGIVLEPSVLVSVTDSTFGQIHQHITPFFKLYLQNFYLGTSIKPFLFSDFWKSIEVYTLFFQYQFPRFYSGVYLEFPKTGFLNDDNIIFEVSLGILLSKEGSRFERYRHW
ncbi:MAG: hypothetical protein CSA96_00480 [Bacteroidetes bacterium]|nr:MAG: hypothetical protein CSA96_00480 [Bacteroidota bacterium]